MQWIIFFVHIRVFVNTALGNMLGSFRQPLPSLTLPFNIITLLIFVCLMPPMPPTEPAGMSGTPLPNTTNSVAMGLVQDTPILQDNSQIALSRTIREADMGQGTPEMTTGEGVGKTQIPNENDLHWGNVCPFPYDTNFQKV